MSQSNTHSITKLLPHLRRFARALTGSRESGDAYVEATFDVLVADPSPLKPENLKVSLYGVFLKIWNSVSLNQTSGMATADGAFKSAIDQRIATLTPLSRQVFLLTAVERFSHSDVASILGVGEGKVDEYLDQAAHEIGQQLPARILIIEDEPLIALDLKELVSGLGHQVTTVARTHKDAVAAAKRDRPGLILADIRLADDSSGVEAVREILDSVDVPVIFATAHPEQLLTGNRLEPVFLVTKPFHVPALKAIISQALFCSTQPSQLASEGMDVKALPAQSTATMT